MTPAAPRQYRGWFPNPLPPLGTSFPPRPTQPRAPDAGGGGRGRWAEGRAGGGRGGALADVRPGEWGVVVAGRGGGGGGSDRGRLAREAPAGRARRRRRGRGGAGWRPEAPAERAG